jgi:hypothetical protein
MAIEKINTGTTTGDKTGDGAKTAGIKINANFEYLENKIDNAKEVLVDAGFSLSGNVLTINAGWQWKLNGINYTNPLAVTFAIPFAVAGKKRRDLIVMNTSNTFTKYGGAEVTGVAVTPTAVAQTITLEIFNVSESNIYNSKAAAPFLGSITPASVPTGTGAAYWHAIQAGPYPNHGGFEVAANSFAVFSRNEAGGFSMSQTTFNLSNYAAKSYVDGLVVGLLDDRGSYNASVNTFPTTGGSGASGAVRKGDLWYVNVAGTLGGKSVKPGASFRALVDDAAQVAANWSILDGNLGYVPENADNKSGDIAAAPTSVDKFPTNKAVVDYVAANAGAIKPFVNQAYPTANAQVSSLGKIWYNTSATAIGDIPGTSSKWVESLSGYADKNNLLNAAPFYEVMTNGVNESVNGYYLPSTGTFTAYSEMKSAKYPINPNENYNVSSRILGSLTALAVYYTSAGVFISSQNIGGGTAIIYNREKLIIPSNAAFVGLTNFVSTAYAVLEKLSFRPATKLEFDSLTSSVNAFGASITKNKTDIQSISTNAVKFEVLTNGVNESVNGYYLPSTGTFTAYSEMKSAKYPIDINNNYYVSSRIFGALTALAVYYTSTGVFISSQNIGGGTAIIYKREKLIIPSNAAFVGLTNFVDSAYAVLEKSSFDAASRTELTALNNKVLTSFTGKKILWMGTSIPALTPANGKAFVTTVAEKLGCEVTNKSVSNTRMMWLPDNIGSLPNPSYLFLGLTGTTAEREAQFISQNITDNTLKAQYLSWGWEQILQPNIATHDIFVFQHGWNDINSPYFAQTTNYESYDRSTFAGAFNYLISKILSQKPNAKIYIIGEWKKSVKGAYEVTNEQEKIANKWGIPFLNLEKKLMWSDMILQGETEKFYMRYVFDGVHPSFGTTGANSCNIIAEEIYNFMKNDVIIR